MSHWLIALMNDGKYQGKQVLPASVLSATLQPAIGLPNAQSEASGYREMHNSAYGMGRETATYRGHLVSFHGGDLPGFHSQTSFMPNDHIGVIVMVIGDHSAPLYDIFSYNVRACPNRCSAPQRVQFWAAITPYLQTANRTAIQTGKLLHLGAGSKATACADTIANRIPCYRNFELVFF